MFLMLAPVRGHLDRVPRTQKTDDGRGIPRYSPKSYRPRFSEGLGESFQVAATQEVLFPTFFIGRGLWRSLLPGAVLLGNKLLGESKSTGKSYLLAVNTYLPCTWALKNSRSRHHNESIPTFIPGPLLGTIKVRAVTFWRPNCRENPRPPGGFGTFHE
jgi:hypothetical protein